MQTVFTLKKKTPEIYYAIHSGLWTTVVVVKKQQTNIGVAAQPTVRLEQSGSCIQVQVCDCS